MLILPLMPLPAAVIIGLKILAAVTPLGLGYYGLKKMDLFKSKTKITLAVLGLKGTGKTTLQNFLRGTSHEGSTPLSGTGMDQVKLIDGDKIIILKKGKDVSGTDEAITHQYEELIEGCDHIIFVTDASKIFDDKEYLKKSRGLLNKINKKMNSLDQEKKLILIGSHRDLLEHSYNSKKIDDSFLSKQFDGLNGNVAATILLDFTSTKDLENLKKLFFK